MSAPLGVGLLGLGTVGSAVARVITERAKRLEAMAGRPIRLVSVAKRHPDKIRDTATMSAITEMVITSDPFAILDNPNVHIVVEVIGGTAPARDLHLAAFERGKHVVTANKELVAKHWNELHEAARMAKRELRYEASVAAAVPIVAAVRQLGASRPRVLRGLLNGTTTYICSQLDAGGSFDDALAEAQRLGYAEADPSADVDGFDPAYKLSILISLLEGRHFHPDNVSRTSLRGVSPDALKSARARGATIRYLATADFGQKATKARVGPEEVALDSLEGAASGPTNVIRLETDLAGTLVFSGPGAGGEATASAILGDVIAIARTAR